MNYIKIKPQAFLNKTATYIKIESLGFTLNSECVNITVTFFEDMLYLPMPTEGNVLYATTLSMIDKDLEGWGSDDTYAEDWCIEQLGLLRDDK